MHPDPSFRAVDRRICAQLVEQVGFAMIFVATPEGPRVVHAPVVLSDADVIQFHVSRRNAVARHLDGAAALCVVNGPDAYVSARWYSDPGQVPTWNYVSVEMEGRLQEMDDQALRAQLEALSRTHESRIAQGTPWTMEKTPEAALRAMMDAIVGFEMRVEEWRSTFKLSQNKPESERRRVIEGLEASGSTQMASLMRRYPA